MFPAPGSCSADATGWALGSAAAGWPTSSALAAPNHPNLVTLHDAATDDGEGRGKGNGKNGDNGEGQE